MLEIFIFVVASAGIVRFSWPSLQDRHTHGFYRFFAFELILALFLLNVRYWFRNPSSAAQIVSWVLLVGSAVLVAEGFRMLRTFGESEGEFENTTQIVCTGVYRFIRHPLYASLLYLAWGAFLKHPSTLGTGLVLAASVFLVTTAKVEEGENLAKFGAEYSKYAAQTRMFIPFLF